METNSETESVGRFVSAKRLGALGLVVLLIVVAYTLFGDALSLQGFAERESQLRDLQEQHPALVYGAAFLLYVTITGLSLPGAAVLTLAYGWYFGFARGLLLVSFASTAGATLAFLFSRFLFRESIQHRFGERLLKFNDALAREGPFFLFTLRLIPAVPFFMINSVMGLTPIRTRTFWWVSQLGMLAGTCVYVYAGASVPNLRILADEGINAVFTRSEVTQIVIAFAMLGVFPLVVRYVMRFVTHSKRKQETKLSQSANANEK